MLRLKTILQSSNLILIILFLTFIYAFIYSSIPKESKYHIDDKLVQGKLISKTIDGDKLTMIIDGKEKVRATFYIPNYKDLSSYQNLALGTTLELSGTLSQPNHNTIPNTFDYHDYLYYQKINYTMSVNNIKIIEANIPFLYKVKNTLIKHINKYQSRAYLMTFILGDKSHLEEGVYENYQSIGVSHIFAISGMHVSLLTGIILKILKKLKENTRYIIVIIFLLIYSFLTDLQPSILRSITLFILLFLNKRLAFNLPTLKVYYLTITTLLIYNPYFIHNIGFQYSSVVSYSLIRNNHLIKGNYIMQCLKISLIAFLYSLPITLMNNYEVNILSVFNNLLYVPLISFVIYPLSLLTLILPFLDSILLTLNHISEYIAEYMLVLNIVIPKVNILFVIIYYILLTCFFISFKKIFLVIILSLIIIVKMYSLIDNNYYVYFLDVGQGDSAIIKYKNETIMIDTGGKVSFKTEAWKEKKKVYLTNNTMKFLKSIGTSKIDYLILTHGDYDHMGEAINVIENFKVDKVIFNTGDYNNLETELIKTLDKKKIKYYKDLKEINIDKDKIQFLNTQIYDNENDNSNVLFLSCHNYKFLFMGDAGVQKEKDILKKYSIKNIDFLKVGHHGSKTSSSAEFITKINPKQSIISVGKKNRYGHPNKEVLETLSDSKIYRTDLDGSVEIKLNKNGYSMETFSP